MSASIYDIPVKKITGEDASLAEFKGDVLLVVNVASKCGLTPQYEGLEKLYEQYKGQAWSSPVSRPTTSRPRSREPTRRFSPSAL